MCLLVLLKGLNGQAKARSLESIWVMTEAQILGPHSAAFPGALAGSVIRSGTAVTPTSALIQDAGATGGGLTFYTMETFWM